MGKHFGNKRKMVIVLFLSFLFCAMQVTGCRIAVAYKTTVHKSAYMQSLMEALTGKQRLLLGILEFAVVGGVLYLLFTLSERIEISKRGAGGRRRWWIWGMTAFFLFLGWMPCYLAGYPGYYNYDAFSQIPQALYEEVPYSAHHPLLHTLVMGKIIAFGYHHGADLNDGIALYSIFQMLLCALAFAYALWYLLKTTGRTWLYIAGCCYYAFFPPIAMFAMSTTKDVLFSVCLLLALVFLYEMCRDMPSFFASRWKVCRFAGMALLACLLRKNGIYAFLCIAPFAALCYRKYGKRLLLLFGAIVFLYITADRGLMWALDAEEGSTREMLSVPMQQLARVYCDYGEEAFSARELDMIYQGIGREQLLEYDPFLADYIKNYVDYEVVLADKSDYMLLWVRKGMQYPQAYIKAFLDNTYQAWYPGTSICSMPGTEHTNYFEMVMWAGGSRDSRAPRLLEFYRRIAEDFYYQKVPIVRLLFSIGGMFWAALYVLGFAAYQKNRPLLLAMLLVLFYCMTVFMGPVSLVRYYLILFYGFPLSIGYLFAGRDNHKQ